MFDIGPEKLLMILVVALLVASPKKIPEVARALGRGLASFRQAVRGTGDGPDPDDDERPGQSKGSAQGQHEGFAGRTARSWPS